MRRCGLQNADHESENIARGPRISAADTRRDGLNGPTLDRRRREGLLPSIGGPS
jgi:hypothetical protein